MLFLVALLACSEAPPPAAPPQSTPTAPTATTADPHAHAHASAGDHMGQMAKTRDELRAALGEAYDQPVPGLDQADVAAGKALYDAQCASCHGAAGKGDGPAANGLTPPPADFTDAFHARFYSDAGRVQIIRKGSPGTAMTGFEGVLTEPQLLEVYAYVRSLRGDAGSSTPAPAPAHDHSAHGDGEHGHPH